MRYGTRVIYKNKAGEQPETKKTNPQPLYEGESNHCTITEQITGLTRRIER